jgi:hypothetical protein
MMTSKRDRENDARREAGWWAECNQWSAEHPGRTSVEYYKLKNDPNLPKNELADWLRAKFADSNRAMRQAWLDDHPGEDPLPEHLCALDNPLPGFEDWCAKARRWLDQYERRP